MRSLFIFAVVAFLATGCDTRPHGGRHGHHGVGAVEGEFRTLSVDIEGTGAEHIVIWLKNTSPMDGHGDEGDWYPGVFTSVDGDGHYTWITPFPVWSGDPVVMNGSFYIGAVEHWLVENDAVMGVTDHITHPELEGGGDDRIESNGLGGWNQVIIAE